MDVGHADSELSTVWNRWSPRGLRNEGPFSFSSDCVQQFWGRGARIGRCTTSTHCSCTPAATRRSRRAARQGCRERDSPIESVIGDSRRRAGTQHAALNGPSTVEFAASKHPRTIVDVRACARSWLQPPYELRGCRLAAGPGTPPLRAHRAPCTELRLEVGRPWQRTRVAIATGRPTGGTARGL